MKIIHCSVWGDMEFSDLAIQIIDTFHFQRLHYIKQTGFAYKVFPTATSSRFEHSLGVYHITRILFNEIRRKQPDVCPEPRIQELVCLAGLIHDLGHGPFSHLFDHFLDSVCTTTNPWKTHEHRSIAVFRDMIIKYNIPLDSQEIEFITARIHDPPRENWYDTLVCNPYSSLDTDKMDYVIRDSLHFGMKFNTDINRIIQNARVIENRLCFCDRIRDEIDLFFQIRERMHRTIYRHPKIKYFEHHLLQFLPIYFKPNIGDMTQFLQFTDSSLLSLIPLEDWIHVETRRAIADINIASDDFQCQQWEKAKQNIKYFKRKTPDISF